jgi:hypothetical protein
MDEIDERVDGLVTELRAKSKGIWADKEPARTAMTNAIALVIEGCSAGIEPALLQSYYGRAKLKFDELIREHDPIEKTLRQALELLPTLLRKAQSK